MDIKNIIAVIFWSVVLILCIAIVIAILWVEWIAIAWLLTMAFGQAPWYVVLFIMILIDSILGAIKYHKRD